ncbi:CU044_2847 family protein [Micromonospora saelicesensis]|uniref:CU044_2847 family protein n=1 Tax=Micromonospora saelicesensis TaxID=285676 RepID=UPI003D91F30D
MAVLARITLEGGGAILVEGSAADDGPVKAGRISEAIQDLPITLQAALQPVTDAARIIMEQLRQARPTQVEVEFGVDLSTQAGAVITKTEIASHLIVKMTWTDAAQIPGGA